MRIFNWSQPIKINRASSIDEDVLFVQLLGPSPTAFAPTTAPPQSPRSSGTEPSTTERGALLPYSPQATATSPPSPGERH